MTWNVSNVTDMNTECVKRLNYASSFNQPLNDWDVSNVTHMESMFDGASSSIRYGMCPTM